jgi:hypothetical protein
MDRLRSWTRITGRSVRRISPGGLEVSARAISGRLTGAMDGYGHGWRRSRQVRRRPLTPLARIAGPPSRRATAGGERLGPAYVLLEVPGAQLRVALHQHQRAEGAAIGRFLGHHVQRLAQRGPDRLACGRRWPPSSSLASPAGATVASRSRPLKLS